MLHMTDFDDFLAYSHAAHAVLREFGLGDKTVPELISKAWESQIPMTDLLRYLDAYNERFPSIPYVEMVGDEEDDE